MPGPCKAWSNLVVKLGPQAALDQCAFSARSLGALLACKRRLCHVQPASDAYDLHSWTASVVARDTQVRARTRAAGLQACAQVRAGLQVAPRLSTAQKLQTSHANLRTCSRGPPCARQAIHPASAAWSLGLYVLAEQAPGLYGRCYTRSILSSCPIPSAPGVSRPFTPCLAGAQQSSAVVDGLHAHSGAWPLRPVCAHASAALKSATSCRASYRA